jgi:hypothetical protein
MATTRARVLPALLALALAAGCRLAPQGSCASDLDCSDGRHCAEGVCVPDGRSSLYGGCAVDRDCDEAAVCAQGVCLLAAGRCVDGRDCATWESCEETVCTPLPGRCTTLDDCAAWELCVAAAQVSPPLPDHRCQVAPGRCAAATDCAGWQVCLPTRFCGTAPGYCATGAECAAWETCGGDHRCATAVGFCATGADCQEWEACGADHRCALAAGRCVVQDDCPPELVCRANACVAQPARLELMPGNVHLVGTLDPGTPGRAAIGLPGSYVTMVGMAAGDLACGVRVTPTGGLLVGRGAAGLAMLVPDQILWDAGADLWTYPADPAANDVPVPLPPGCEGAVSISVVQQQGTGARLVDCGGLEWRAEDGAIAVSGQPLLAWSSEGLKLAGVEGMVVPPVLLDATGVAVPVTGLPAGRLLAGARAHGLGFDVVITAGATAQLADLEVWSIDASGAAALVGALPALPPSVTEVDPPVLDGVRDVYQLGRTSGGDVVIRRIPGGVETMIVHDDAGLPAATSLLDAPVHAEGGCLLTGP